MKRMFLLILTIPILLFTQLSVAEAESELQDEVIYNILIDRFNVGDHDFNDQVRINDPFAYQGGDFLGITKKLDDLDELGFTTITLSPIMANANDGYHGYWIEDFYTIEEQFGTMEDFNTLVEEAHKRDMKVIVEFVTNYVALSHPIVSEGNKEDWFTENKDERTPSTEWLDNVVNLNHENEEVVNYLIDAAEFWMEETEIDGFKLHHADLASESFLEQFTTKINDIDSNFQLLANTSGSGESVEHLVNNPHIQAIDNVSIYEKLDEVFTEPDVPVSILYDTWEEAGSNKDLLFIDNENTPRFSNVLFENGRNALNTWKLALTYMYTTPGIPSIYQGSELPMYGPGFPENQRMMQFNSTDPDLEEFFHRISAIREQFPALVYGDFEHVDSNDAMSLFKRSYEGEALYIAINNSTVAKGINTPIDEPGKQLRGLLGDDIIRANNDGEYQIDIARETIEVYMIEEDIGLNWVYIIAVGAVMSLFILMIIYLSRKQKARG